MQRSQPSTLLLEVSHDDPCVNNRVQYSLPYAFTPVVKAPEDSNGGFGAIVELCSQATSENEILTDAVPTYLRKCSAPLGLDRGGKMDCTC